MTRDPWRSNRRTFLGSLAGPLGALGLASLGLVPAASFEGAARGTEDTGRHLIPRARRVIHLYQAGGPSHLETFDNKPRLLLLDGQAMPESVTRGQQIAQLQGERRLKCLGPQHPFRRFGESGQEICALFPHLGTVADEIAIVRSLHTDQINHDPAHAMMNCGTPLPGRPSMGSWVLYGIGSETSDLPGFLVLTSVGKGGQAQPIASRQWHSGFLPGQFQGVHLQSRGDPVHYVSRPPGVDATRQRDVVATIAALDQDRGKHILDPELETRIRQYEMAFRMQASVPDLMNLAEEPPSVIEMYGATPGDGSFASNCLLARRLAERGVRFIQVYHRGWDHHGNVKRSMEITAREVDQASAALLKDLKQRGMLDDTLVIFGGEFGRSPMAQGTGRDHHIRGFSLWMAGGGVKGGLTYGATDDLGYHAVEDPVHVNDLHATILYLLGIDHRRLTFKTLGRDFRLTDVAGTVVRPILAS